MTIYSIFPEKMWITWGEVYFNAEVLIFMLFLLAGRKRSEEVEYGRKVL